MSQANSISRVRSAATPPGLLVITAMLLTGLAEPGMAQVGAKADDNGELTEIIVTSTRREENVQAVPVSVAVLTGAELAVQGITEVDQYTSAVPGLSFNRTGFGDRDGLDLTIRGISNTRLADSTGGTGALTTGFYIDDVAVLPVDIFLYDIARMEVLKGPQGTLFGQASMGGTVRMITNQPDSKTFFASSEVNGALTDGGGPSSGIRGVLNVPLIENKLAVRLLAFDDEQGGWIKWDPASLAPGASKGPNPAVPPGTPGDIVATQGGANDVNTQATRGGRISLRYTPTDNLTITPFYMYQTKTSPFSSFIDRNLDQGYLTQNYIQEPRSEQFSQLALTVNYDMSFARLTSISAEFVRDYRWRQDTTSFIAATYGLTPAGGIPSTAWLDFDFNTRVDSEELRLSSIDSKFLDWIVGAAYFDEHRRQDLIWLAPGFNATAAAPIPGGGSTGFSYGDEGTNGFTNFSVFADLTLKLFDEHLQLSAGARRFDQKFTQDSVGTGAMLGAVGTLVPGTPVSGSETGTTPRFAIKYAFDPSAMVYASATQGFRAGGPGAAAANQQTAACLDALAKAGLEPGGSFKSDKLTSYELGSKTSWANNRFLLDGALFYVDWSDLQNSFILNNFNVDCPGVTTGNGGKASSKGGELSAAYQPSASLSLRLAASYTDAKLGQQPLGSPLLEGTRLQNAPEWQGTLSAQYNFTLPVTGYDGFIRGDFSYYGWQWSNQSSEPNPFFYVPARSIANVHFGVAPRENTWSAEFYVANAFNREQIYGSQSFFGEPNTEQALVGRPRSVGVSVRYSWH